MKEKFKKNQLKIQYSLVFASFALLIFGVFSVIEDGGINYYSMVGLRNKVFPGVVILALLGWFIGAILDKAYQAPKQKGYNNSLLEELLRAESLSSEGDMTEVPPVDFVPQAGEDLQGGVSNFE